MSASHGHCGVALICAGVWCVLIGFPVAALGFSYGSLVSPQGPEELVFDGPGPCASPPGVQPASTHSVDGPARAFRDATGRVQLILPHGRINRRLIGSSLGSLGIDCTVVHLANGRWTPPETYANGAWLTAAYRLGDGTVRALLHNEYHGLFTDPPDCSPGMGDQDCWMGSITSAVSTDNGDNFTYQPAPAGHLVAAMPYPYEPDWGAQGFQNPTNVVLSPSDGVYYTMFNVRVSQQTAPAKFRDQEIGECVMRSGTLDPTSWRAWNGASFAATFINPYDPGYDPVSDPPNHVCTPVSTTPEKLGRTFAAHALTYSTFFNKHMAIGQQTRDGVRGFWYSLSDNMVDWSTPRLIRTSIAHGDCANPEKPTIYPSIIDAADPTPNFERPGQYAYLYFLRMMCTAVDDRDMVRVPIKFERPLRWSTGAAQGCPGGFDAHVTSGSATVTTDPARNYSGDASSYRSDTAAGGGQAYGVFDREDYPVSCAEEDPGARPTFKYSAGNDISYSAAFLLPSDGFWNRSRGDVTLLRLDNRPAADDTAGAVSVGADSRLHFTTDPSDLPGDEVEILKSGSTNGVPLADDGCWHFIEVHQRLGDSGAVNELWLDGIEQTTLAGVDNFHGAPYDRVRAGVVSAGTVSGPLTVFTDMSGYGYVGPLSAISCSGVTPSAPVALNAVAPQQATLQLLTRPPAQESGCRVPKLKGLTVRRARAKLRKAGCRYRVTGKGRVRSSSPKAGATTAATVRVKCKRRKAKP